MEAENRMTTWRVFFRFARPYRGQFTVVALLAFLGTMAELAEPLIYRIAVNDVAGVFVQRATEQSNEPGISNPHPSSALFSRFFPASQQSVPTEHTLERNRGEHPSEVGKPRSRGRTVTRS